MRARSIALAPVLVLVLAVVVAACVPEVGRPGGSATGSGASATLVPAPTGPTPSPSFVAPTPTPVPSFRAYEVVAGDTLLSIARTFETTARSIAYWNRGTFPNLDPESEEYSPNRIQVGWQLLIIPGAVVDPQTLPDQTPRPRLSGSECHADPGRAGHHAGTRRRARSSTATGRGRTGRSR